MARTERLVVMVEPSLSAEIKRLAEGMQMPVSGLLNLLLTIAVNSTGDTFQAFGNTIEALKGSDESE